MSEKNKQKSTDIKKLKKVKPILGKRKVKAHTTSEREAIVKKNKEAKPKKERIKNFQHSVRIFPTLMVREMRRVRWARRYVLNRTFWLTVGFITFFAIFFAIIQNVLTVILKLSKVM